MNFVKYSTSSLNGNNILQNKLGTYNKISKASLDSNLICSKQIINLLGTENDISVSVEQMLSEFNFSHPVNGSKINLNKQNSQINEKLLCHLEQYNLSDPFFGPSEMSGQKSFLRNLKVFCTNRKLNKIKKFIPNPQKKKLQKKRRRILSDNVNCSSKAGPRKINIKEIDSLRGEDQLNMMTEKIDLNTFCSDFEKQSGTSYMKSSGNNLNFPGERCSLKSLKIDESKAVDLNRLGMQKKDLQREFQYASPKVVNSDKLTPPKLQKNTNSEQLEGIDQVDWSFFKVDQSLWTMKLARIRDIATQNELNQQSKESLNMKNVFGLEDEDENSHHYSIFPNHFKLLNQNCSFLEKSDHDKKSSSMQNFNKKIQILNSNLVTKSKMNLFW